MKLKTKNKENNLICEIAHSGAVGVDREELQLQETGGGFRAPSVPASPAESLSQAEEPFAVSWAALYWLHWLLGTCSGACGAFALTAWLFGYLCHDKSARDVDPSSVG